MPHEEGVCFDHFIIGRLRESHTSMIMEIGEYRRYADIVQSGSHGVGIGELTVVVLQKISLVALSDSGMSGTVGDTRGMHAVG